MSTNLLNGVTNSLSNVILSYAQELYGNPLKLLVLFIDVVNL